MFKKSEFYANANYVPFSLTYESEFEVSRRQMVQNYTKLKEQFFLLRLIKIKEGMHNGLFSEIEYVLLLVFNDLLDVICWSVFSELSQFWAAFSFWTAHRFLTVYQFQVVHHF